MKKSLGLPPPLLKGGGYKFFDMFQRGGGVYIILEKSGFGLKRRGAKLLIRMGVGEGYYQKYMLLYFIHISYF